MVRPAISSVSRCIASRRSTVSPTWLLRSLMASSIAACMCGTSIITARGENAGASVRRWCFQARPSDSKRPSLPRIWTQHADADRRARIILVVLDQHMADRIRRVDDEIVLPEEAAFQNVFLIGGLAPAIDAAAPDRGHPPDRRHGVRLRRGPRRHQQRSGIAMIIGFGNAHEGLPFGLACGLSCRFVCNF